MRSSLLGTLATGAWMWLSLTASWASSSGIAVEAATAPRPGAEQVDLSALFSGMEATSKNDPPIHFPEEPKGRSSGVPSRSWAPSFARLFEPGASGR